jgi:hypothetical protein
MIKEIPWYTPYPLYERDLIGCAYTNGFLIYIELTFSSPCFDNSATIYMYIKSHISVIHVHVPSNAYTCTCCNLCRASRSLQNLVESYCLPVLISKVHVGLKGNNGKIVQEL